MIVSVSVLLLLLLFLLGGSDGGCRNISCFNGNQIFSDTPCLTLADCYLLTAEVIISATNVSMITVQSSSLAALSITIMSTPFASVAVLNTNIRADNTTSTTPCFGVSSALDAVTRRVDVLVDHVEVTWTVNSSFPSAVTMAAVMIATSTGAGGGGGQSSGSNVTILRSSFALLPQYLGTPRTMLGALLNIKLPNRSSVLVADTQVSCLGGEIRDEYNLVAFDTLVATSVLLRNVTTTFMSTAVATTWEPGSNTRGLITFFDLLEGTSITLLRCNLTAVSNNTEAAFTSLVNLAGSRQKNFTVVMLRCRFRFNVSMSEATNRSHNSRVNAFRMHQDASDALVFMNDSFVTGDSRPYSGAMSGVSIDGRCRKVSVVVANTSLDFRGSGGVWLVNYGDRLFDLTLSILDVSFQCRSIFNDQATFTNQCMVVYWGNFTITSLTATVLRLRYSATLLTDYQTILFTKGALVCSMFSTGGPGSTLTNTSIDVQFVTLLVAMGGSQAFWAPVVFTFMSPNETSITNLNFTIRDCVVSFDIVVLAGIAAMLGIQHAKVANSRFSILNTSFVGTATSVLGAYAKAQGYDPFGIACIAFDTCTFLDVEDPSVGGSLAEVINSTVSVSVSGQIGLLQVIGANRGAAPAAIALIQSKVNFTASTKPVNTITIPANIGFLNSTRIGNVSVRGCDLRVECNGCPVVSNIAVASSTFAAGACVVVEDSLLSMDRGGYLTDQTRAHVSIFGGSTNNQSTRILLRNLVATGRVLNSLIAWDVSSATGGVMLTVENVSGDQNGNVNDGAAPNAMVTISPLAQAPAVVMFVAPIRMALFQNGVIDVAQDKSSPDPSVWPADVAVVYKACHVSDSWAGGRHLFPLLDFSQVEPRTLFSTVAAVVGNGTRRACAVMGTETLSETAGLSATRSTTASRMPQPGQNAKAKTLPSVAITRSEVVAAATGVVMAAAIPGAGFAIQRALSQIALSGGATFDPTAPMSVADSPTQMNLGKPVYGPMRGCVVGNVALWCGCVGAAAMVSFVLGRRNGVGFAVAGSRLGLPGKLSIPFDLLLQPTASSSMTLFLYRQDDGDMFLGVVGMCVCALWCFVWWRGFRLLKSVPVHPEPIPCEVRAGDGPVVGAAVAAIGRIRFLKAHACRWACRTPLDKPAFDAYLPRFEDYGPRRQWFLAVDIGSGLLLALLVAYMQSPNDDTPQMALTAGNLTVCALVLLSCVAWAQNERLARLNYLSTAVISLVSAALGAASEFGAAEAVAVAQVYLSLLLASVNMAEVLSSHVVSAIRANATVMGLAAARLGGLWRQVSSLSGGAGGGRTARRPGGELLGAATMQELLALGLAAPRPPPHPAYVGREEVAANLAILVTYVATKRNGL